MSDYRNEYEIRIIGLRHSGIHAIVNWVASLFEESIWFFNDCKIPCIDPFTNRGACGQQEQFGLTFANWDNLKNDRDIEKARNTNKKCILMGFEDKDLAVFADERYILPDRDKYVGKSKYVFNVVLLRDYHNYFATNFYNQHESNWLCNFPKFNSIFKLNLSDKDYNRYGRSIVAKNYSQSKWKTREKWKSYAREILGITNFIDNKICILYNKWFQNKEYRKKLAESFGLINNDRFRNIVSQVYGNRSTSRIDGDSFNGKGAEMRVLERYKLFDNNLIYQNFINEDQEAVGLSNKLFGKVIDNEQTC